MYKDIVDAFFSLNNTVGLYLATEQWMKTCTDNKCATKVHASPQNVDKQLEAAMLQSSQVVQSSSLLSPPLLHKQRNAENNIYPVLRWNNPYICSADCHQTVCRDMQESF